MFVKLGMKTVNRSSLELCKAVWCHEFAKWRAISHVHWTADSRKATFFTEALITTQIRSEVSILTWSFTNLTHKATDIDSPVHKLRHTLHRSMQTQHVLETSQML